MLSKQNSPFEASPAELKEARKRLRAETAVLVTPRGGVSVAMGAQLDQLEHEFKNRQPTRKRMAAIMAEGSFIAVDIFFDCFPLDLCVRRKSKKGAPGKMFACQRCQKRFHSKCLVEAGILEKRPGKHVAAVFDCPECSGVPVE
jgi:hypothetical protein